MNIVVCADSVPGAMNGDAEIGAACAGVPVVRLGAGTRRFELDEAALRRVLLRSDPQDLPVVVLSVAGACRGGKSFILDFFLRYLNAPRSSQLNGEWLGREDEQLKGFHWRGGGDRDTTGIHLWPEPITITLDNGEQVAVLLMDTQGTFDSESTIGQSVTIFALSTLISSVQIYNLFGNIREDDLQHLQLFTEYGKLACEAEGKAFQTLLFLVRDWIYPYEHAYGFVGGQALLNKKIQSKPNQNAELREVREHINSSFEQIKCFLMPQPGQSISNESFSGCIRDLTDDFKSALLVLVPSLFDLRHLTPKLINGERVRTQDLFEYFQQYVDIFNGDEVPQATTIFKATADACLRAMVRAARSEFETRMRDRVGGARIVTERALRAAHADARTAAARHAHTRQFGSQQDVNARLADLLRELDGRLSQYIEENEAKVRENMSLAKRTYESCVSSVCGEHARLCLPPRDLRELHAVARLAALTLFDAARDVSENDEDDQRPEFEQILEQKYEYLCTVNDQNNNSAVLAARDLYLSHMRRELEQAGAGVGSDQLEAHNQRALNDAKAFLETQRNRPTRHNDDPFLEQLLQQINECFEGFARANNISKEVVLQAAENKYNNCVMMDLCYHPTALEVLHRKAKEAALQQCLSVRDDDECKTELTAILDRRYSELVTTNESNNRRTVQEAVDLYTKKMAKIRESGPGFTWLLRANARSKFPEKHHHDECKQEAVQLLKEGRRGADYPDDKFYICLTERVDTAYRNPDNYDCLFKN